MDLHWAYLSIGSNLGDRLQNCCRGIAALCADSSIELLARSPFYETAPVDYKDQGWFLNAALKIQTARAPLDLLACMQAVQTAVGRKDGGARFGPRILDLDIIFYEALVMNTPELTIPHSRMHKRRFVLQPMCDIDPLAVHPVLGRNVKSLLKQLTADDQTLRPFPCDC
ncbi:MAG: 2-amino-4-hydroxy-6-hydroxymethyldihydropteridine diphosphokinase [Desulfatitalea sp.]